MELQRSPLANILNCLKQIILHDCATDVYILVGDAWFNRCCCILTTLSFDL